jgi:hypothetical protein
MWICEIGTMGVGAMEGEEVVVELKKFAREKLT